jgi:heme oxygenase
MVLRRLFALELACLLLAAEGFLVAPPRAVHISTTTALWATTPTPTTASFIDTELRGAAMKLHTRQQAPKEGEAPATAKKMEPYVTTQTDYLRFLVDSKHVYEALEDIVNTRPELDVFRSTGLERVAALEKDIAFMMNEYSLDLPAVNSAGLNYADKLRSIESIPELVCHYYNFYFAHTAGGRMIGKQMSALLLEKRTLEFYKVRTLSYLLVLAKLWFKLYG